MPTPTSDTPTDESKVAKRRHRGKIVLVLWIALVFLVVGGTLAGRASTFTSDSRGSTYTSGKPGNPDRIDIQARVMDVDPTSDSMTVRLITTPRGRYALPSGAMAIPVNLTVDGVPGGSDTFDAGKLPVPVQSTLGLAGDLSQYPFDRYTSLLVVEASSPALRGLLPVHLTVSAGQRDWKISSSNASAVLGNAITVDLATRRGGSTIGFALFEMAIMMILAGIALAITFVTVVAGAQLEFSYFTWLGALIFALPAVRNALPGSPGIGTLVDCLVFFPALATVTVCMLAAAITFVRRSHAKR